MDDNTTLLHLLDSGDAALASASALHAALARARLELAFSRTQHRGSLAGASFAYVPKGALRAAVRVRLVADGGSRLAIAAVKSSRSPISTRGMFQDFNPGSAGPAPSCGVV